MIPFLARFLIFRFRCAGNLPFKPPQIKVERTKGKRVRFVPIDSMLFDVLTRMKAENPSGLHVFNFRTKWVAHHAFRHDSKKSGIDDFTFRDLRRTFGTRAYEEGVKLSRIQKWLGHRDILMTMRYLHLSDDEDNSDIERLVNRAEKRGNIAENLAQIWHTEKEEAFPIPESPGKSVS